MLEKDVRTLRGSAPVGNLAEYPVHLEGPACVVEVCEYAVSYTWLAEYSSDSRRSGGPQTRSRSSIKQPSAPSRFVATDASAHTDRFPESTGYLRAVLDWAATHEFGRDTILEIIYIWTTKPKLLHGPMGGHDAPPSPVDYVLFGMAACQVFEAAQTQQKGRV